MKRVDFLKDACLHIGFQSRTINALRRAEHPPSSYLNIPKLNTQFSPIPVLCHQEKMINSSSNAKFTARLMRLIPVDLAQETFLEGSS